MALQLLNIKKSYTNQFVLDDISLTFEDNTIYGLFGKNGSGKTTLLEIACGSDVLYEGNVIIDNQNIFQNEALYREVYFLGTNFLRNGFFSGRKIKKLLRIFKEGFELFDYDYAYTLVEKLKLPLNKSVNKLSLGEQSLFTAVIGFSLKCRFVLFDEPLEGLDAMNREWFYQQLIQTQNKRKNTFIITSHIVDELELAIQQVLFLKDNKIVVNEELESLKSRIVLVKQFNQIIDESIFQSIIYKQNNSIETQFIGELKHDLPHTKLSLQEIFVAYHKEDNYVMD